MNQCLTNNGGCDHICTNELPGFSCSCRPGYQLQTDNKKCLGKYSLLTKSICNNYTCSMSADINECETEGTCEDECFNTDGSFLCLCTANTILNNDGKSCLRELLLYSSMYNA